MAPKLTTIKPERNAPVITGVGMVTSVGHDAQVAVTSLRADITRMQEFRLRTRQGYPLVGAPIAGFAEQSVREARLWELAGQAAGEAIAQADSAGDPLDRARCGVVWVVPQESRTGYDARDNDHHLHNGFIDRCKLGRPSVVWRDLPRGHAGALLGLSEAAKLLAQGRVTSCLIGGADTLLQLRVLRWLEAEHRLKTDFYTDGLIPGEAAAFLVVESEDVVRVREGRILARVKGLGISHEDATIVSDEPCRARGLTAAFRVAFESAAIQPAAVGAIYCDLNGESYRAREWGLASTRLAFPDGADLIHPADCLGDVGAATGTLLLAMAAMSMAHSPPTAPNALVFAGSESGERAAAVLERVRSQASTSGEPGAAARTSPRFVKPIPDILDEHADELPFLWSQRRSALRSPRHSAHSLARLERRIEAHVQGLLVVGESAVPFIEPYLSGHDTNRAFAAGHVLLRSGAADQADRVFGAFERAGASPSRLDGLRQAICQGPIGPILPGLQRLVRSADDLVAVAASEALAFHAALELRMARLLDFLRSPSPNVRQAGWRVVALLDEGRLELFRSGWRDPDPGVRRESLFAAACVRQRGLLEHCRKLSRTPAPDHFDAIEVLALLGGPDDLRCLLTAGQCAGLGPHRYRILGAFGHPGVVETLLKGIEDPDPSSAVAAGAAFTKLTGREIDSDFRIELPPEDGSEPAGFDKYFLDEAFLPDPARAWGCWREIRERLAGATRWSRGFDLSQGASREVLARLDLESYWQACLRGQWEGTWHGNMADLEVFPRGRGRMLRAPRNLPASTRSPRWRSSNRVSKTPRMVGRARPSHGD
jgi:uncharacterized protein (TIGR02270 family)